MKYCIGVDGGGSKTLAYLGDMQGNILKKKNFGPSNYQIIGKKSTELVLKEIVEYFINKKNIGNDDLKFISAGIAGLDRERDRKVLKSIFDSMNLPCDVILQNDSYTSLAGGLNYQNGLIALKMIMKVYDGRLEKTKLYYELLKKIQVDDPRDTITYAYDKVHNTREIASLTPLVFEYLKEKDSLSLRLVNAAVDDLYNLVYPLIGKLYSEQESFLFTYSGSIILKNKYIKNHLIKKLQEIYPNMSPIDPIYNSAIGALIDGWSKYNIDYKENLKNSWEV